MLVFFSEFKLELSFVSIEVFFFFLSLEFEKKLSAKGLTFFAAFIFVEFGDDLFEGILFSIPASLLTLGRAGAGFGLTFPAADVSLFAVCGVSFLFFYTVCFEIPVDGMVL